MLNCLKNDKNWKYNPRANNQPIFNFPITLYPNLNLSFSSFAGLGAPSQDETHDFFVKLTSLQAIWELADFVFTYSRNPNTSGLSH